MTKVFDPVQYKRTTREQWQTAAETWLGPATNLMLDMAQVKEGHHILDIAAIIYSTVDKNKFFSIPVSVIRKHAQLPPPLPGQPGPFSLGVEGVLDEAFKQAGFANIRYEVVNAPVLMSTAKDCVRFEYESFAALHQMLGGLSDEEKVLAWQEIEDELSKFENGAGLIGPCELVVGVGQKPLD